MKWTTDDRVTGWHRAVFVVSMIVVGIITIIGIIVS